MSDNLMSRGVSMLRRQLPASAGGSITYSRGSSTVDITAWVGRMDAAALATQQARVEDRDRDFLFLATGLILGGIAATPLRGDRIIQGGVAYEVLPASGEPSWRYADDENSVIRVHTKRIG